jgi:hypothetical protein
LFFATIETVCTSIIVWQAWTWSEVKPALSSERGRPPKRSWDHFFLTAGLLKKYSNDPCLWSSSCRPRTAHST